MLLGSQASAEDMISKLNAGADFVTEGKTNSLYKKCFDDGGDLGFITKGVMGDAVDAVIFPEDSTKTLPLIAFLALSLIYLRQPAVVFGSLK